MNSQETISPGSIKRRQKGMRLNGNLTPVASLALEELEEMFDIGKYANISAALIIYAKLMRGESIGFINPVQTQNNVIQPMRQRETRSASKTSIAVNALKSNWCTEFGGDYEGGVCSFNKYEVTLAGQTEKSQRQIAVADMPHDKDAFKKLMLGPYDNKYEAERAIERGN